jgi:hypothetical protein
MAYDAQLVDRLRHLLLGEPGVTEKKMFGGFAFLVDGHLSVTASRQGGLMLRVEPARTEELLAEPHVEPVEMRGRELSGWVLVGAAGLESDAELERWTGLGVTYARTLPPS